MGCGASLADGGLGLAQDIEQRGIRTNRQLIREPHNPPTPARSALVGHCLPSQCGGAAGVVPACSAGSMAAPGTVSGVPDDTVPWQRLSESVWAHSVAKALDRQHQGRMVDICTCHPLAVLETMREFDAAADTLFWGTVRLSPLPLTWRMAIVQLHRLRRLYGLSTGQELYDHHCSEAGVEFATKICAFNDFEVGTEVRIQGMTQKQAVHNGEVAIVSAIREKKRLYDVELETGVVLREVPQENLAALDDLNKLPELVDEEQEAAGVLHGCDLGGAISGGRSPLDVVETLLSDPLQRRSLPLWAHTEVFGLGFAQGRLDSSGKVCGVVPQRIHDPSNDPPHSRPTMPRFVTYPPDGDTLAVRGAARNGAWRGTKHGGTSGLVVSLVFTDPADVDGFLSCDTLWLDVTDAVGDVDEHRHRHGNKSEGVPVPYRQSDPSHVMAAYPNQDMVLLGAETLLPPGRRYRVIFTLSLSAGAERLVWEFNTAPAVSFHIAPVVSSDSDLPDQAPTEIHPSPHAAAEAATAAVAASFKPPSTSTPSSPIAPLTPGSLKTRVEAHAPHAPPIRKRFLKKTRTLPDDSAGGYTTDIDQGPDGGGKLPPQWPWAVAVAVAGLSDELILDEGDYAVPQGWWCRLRRICGKAPDVTRLLLPPGGFHVTGRLVIENLSLVQQAVSAPVLWLHEHSVLTLHRARVVGTGVRLCAGTHAKLDIDHCDFRQWLSAAGGRPTAPKHKDLKIPKNLGREGGDNVCIFLQATALLRCGAGNVFSHRSNGELVSTSRPAVLALSPNCLWPHPAVEFTSYVELEKLAHGWVWPLPHLAERMPAGYDTDGREQSGKLWPQEWHAMEAARGGVRANNSLGLVLACAQPGDMLMLGSGIFELPEHWWCSLGEIHGAGVERTTVRLPLDSCIHVAVGLELLITNCNVEARTSGSWFWVLGRLRLRNTQLLRFGDCGGSGGGRICVGSTGELSVEGGNNWVAWGGVNNGGGRLVAMQPGGRLSGSGHGNHFGSDAFACEVGTGRSIEMCWLARGWLWPTHPPLDLAEAAPAIPKQVRHYNDLYYK